MSGLAPTSRHEDHPSGYAVRAEAKSAEQKAAVERLVRAYHEIARPEANADVDPRPILRELHEALRDLGDAFPKDLEL